ncbi:SDR family NAD(P)-dependent oxidoreductase [Streptomonospora litoralis]|uniref:3-oxoacyl-[acyl-carrier-protein] reductase FabG n=1 Tax=Streptomonospora litoralis TaxID=2498135 RepID=A0A4P6QAN6_9ACTN|nr:SDR family oxidoreductase [Streptomonospora litoralis]QBI56357.1 3-oxoacyl-[acyl-carrier-protein] reductase FabG [Streptomonospora litoralis]
MRIDGAVVVVTGGGTGIGRAACLEAARRGAAGVVLTYARSAGEAEDTAAEIEARDVPALPVRADVADTEQVEDMAKSAVERFGRVDALVNNAGTTRAVAPDDLAGLTDDMWREILDVNVVGAFRCARALERPLRAAGGAIVNTSSISAFRAGGSSIAYGVSKAALQQLTRSLAAVLAPEVRVNAVAPGTVATRWQTDLRGEDGFAEFSSKEREVIPLRSTTQPEQVAHTLLAMLEMDAVTGETLVIDGGKHVLY